MINSRKLQLRLLSVVLLSFFITDQLSALGQEPKQLDDFVKQLADPSFRSRETAARRLIAAGTVAIEPLEQAVRGGNLEIIDRASLILQDLALLETPDSDTQAWSAIERLKATGPGAATTRAVSSLDLIRRDRVQRARTALSTTGIKAGVQIFERNGGLTSDVVDMLRIDQEWNGEVDALQWMPWLYSSRLVAIDNAVVDAEMMEAIAKLPNLREIHIRETKISAEAVRKLSTLKRLDILELHFVDFGSGEDDLFALASLPLKQEVTLTGTKFDSEDAEARYKPNSKISRSFIVRGASLAFNLIH